MDELYIKLRKHVYERLDIGRDVADSELYEVIDACIYDESRNNVISIRQKEELKQRLYNSIKKLDILWLMFGGIITAVEYLIASLLMMFTIIGIPFGMQTLKMASLALWPFGKEVRSGERSNGCLYVLMNILWIFLGGIWICLSHLGFGLLLCITIIGIPFGIQHFKLAGLALTPFGKDIVAA